MRPFLRASGCDAKTVIYRVGHRIAEAVRNQALRDKGEQHLQVDLDWLVSLPVLDGDAGV